MTKEKFPKRYAPFYLVDPVRCDYEELSLINMRKKIGKSESFIYDRCNDGALFLLDGRAYYITNNFAKVWELI